MNESTFDYSFIHSIFYVKIHAGETAGNGKFYNIFQYSGLKDVASK